MYLSSSSQIERSMIRLETVVQERETALRLLQTGQEKARPGAWRRNTFGYVYWWGQSLNVLHVTHSQREVIDSLFTFLTLENQSTLKLWVYPYLLDQNCSLSQSHSEDLIKLLNCDTEKFCRQKHYNTILFSMSTFSFRASKTDFGLFVRWTLIRAPAPCDSENWENVATLMLICFISSRYRFKEYAIPWYMNKRYKRKRFYTPKFVEPHMR